MASSFANVNIPSWLGAVGFHKVKNQLAPIAEHKPPTEEEVNEARKGLAGAKAEQPEHQLGSASLREFVRAKEAMAQQQNSLVRQYATAIQQSSASMTIPPGLWQSIMIQNTGITVSNYAADHERSIGHEVAKHFRSKHAEDDQALEIMMKKAYGEHLNGTA